MLDYTDVVYVYDDTYDGFLCCVFESFLKKEIPAGIVPLTASQMTLFPTRWIETDTERAGRVLRSFPQKLSPFYASLLLHAFLTCLEEKEMKMLALIHAGFAGISFNCGKEPLHSIFFAVQFLKREAQHYKGFIRFSDYNGYLVTQIQPKNYVLPLIRRHFQQRFPQDTLLIFDETHHLALSCEQGVTNIFSLDTLALEEAGEREQYYRKLWKTYHQTIAIEQRLNPTLQRSLLPKRYWNQMTEFQI